MEYFSSDNEAIIQGDVVTWPTIIKQMQAGKITLIECEFHKALTFDKTDLTGSITFINCKFHWEVTFNECHSKNDPSLASPDSPNSPYLHFKNCTFETISFNKCSLYNSINFEVCEIHTLSFTNHSSGKITLTACEFKNTVAFVKADLTGTTAFINCKSHWGVTFNECSSTDSPALRSLSHDLPQLLFNECTFVTISFKKCSLYNSIDFENTQVNTLSFIDHNEVMNNTQLVISRTTIGALRLKESDLTFASIYNSKITQELMTTFTDGNRTRLNLNTCKIEGKVWIRETIHGFDAEDCNFENEIIFHLKSKTAVTDKISLRYCTFAKPLIVESFIEHTIETVELTGGDTFSGSLVFVDNTIKNIFLTGNFLTANINFQGTKLENIEFNEYSNAGLLSLLTCRIENAGRFEARNSDLGKTRFLGFDFSEFRCVTLSNSFLSEIACSSCEWFDDERLIRDKKTKFYGKREIYRQLKQAAEKQGNRIHALEFQSRELDAFRWEIASRKHFFTSDRLTLLLGLTNQFGLNWLLPLGLLIGTTLVFYMLIMICTSPVITFTPAKSMADVSYTLAILWDRSEVLIQLFNPAHNLSHLFKDPIATSVYWLDGIHRIIAAFLIVQIVSAFRKFYK